MSFDDAGVHGEDEREAALTTADPYGDKVSSK